MVQAKASFVERVEAPPLAVGVVQSISMDQCSRSFQGRNGHDILRGGSDNDVQRGGRHRDRFHLSAGRDQILNFNPNQGPDLQQTKL